MAKDLKSCLRTGAGTRGHAHDAERLKYYKMYCRLEPNLDVSQKEQIESWEKKLCNVENDPEFSRVLDIVQKRKNELQALGKRTLEACFQTNKSNEDKDLRFVRNFFNRKKNSLTSEQEAQLEILEMEICSGDVALRPVTDALFARVVDIIQRRKEELEAMGKTTLEACFQTKKSNEDKDLNSVRNFFIRKKNSLTSGQQEKFETLETEICAGDVALRPVTDALFARVVDIIQKQKDELQALGKSSLEACFQTHRSNEDKDLKFVRNFFHRKKNSLTSEQEAQLEILEMEICTGDVALRPVTEALFARVVEIIQKQKDELQALGKSSLEACFQTNKSNEDKDLTFVRNFFRRKKFSLTSEQEAQLENLEMEICTGDVALRPVTEALFARVVEIIQKQKDELQALGKSSLEACFQTNKSNENKDLTFVRNFFRRKQNSLTAEQQEKLQQLESEICAALNLEDFDRFLSILRNRAQELAHARLPDLDAVLSSRRIKDGEMQFCRSFWQRNASRLTPLQQEEVENIAVTFTYPVRLDDRVALRPAINRLLTKFEKILVRRHVEFLGVGAASTRDLFSRHVKKIDPEVRFCYDFLARVFPGLTEAEQQRVRILLENVLVTTCQVPVKSRYQAKLHDTETVLGDALPRPRLPKSLRQLYGNSMDAEARIMTFFHRVHEVDTYMTSLEFQDCDYCHEGWFGTRKKRAELPGGFETDVYKKTNFLCGAVAQRLDPSRPICENCLLEAKRRASEGLPKEPVRLTAANYADPGVTLPETDALSFFEEEILSPIQHIVRIFTLHATGQCELRGHVGNLFQNGPQYVRNIPAAIGDMKMLLVRRRPKDPNRKQRVPFLVSRRRLERALRRICRPLQEGGSLAMQPGALTAGGFTEMVRLENLKQFADTEEGAEPEGLQVQVVEQKPWDRIEKKMFAMWMSTSLELQMAAQVRLLHEPEAAEDDVRRVEGLWENLRGAMDEKCADIVGGPDDLVLGTLAGYLSMHFDDKSVLDVEKILHDELTAVQEIASWEEPLVSDGLWSPEDLAGQQTEADLKDDLWESICQANDSSSSKSTIHRFGAARVKGAPILDPPTVTSRNQLIREDQPYYIVAGFVKLFPLGQGDYWAHVQQRQQETYEPLSFWEWLKHLLLRSDGRFQAHPRFYFFALNTALRNKALRARGYFMKRQQASASNVVAYTAEELFKMGKAQFTKIVSAFEHSMAGSAQEKLRQRSDLEAMVEQIEQQSLEDQAHALLHSWHKGCMLANMLHENGFVDAEAEMRLVCKAAKAAIDKVLSPETIAAAPKPTISRVAVDRKMKSEEQEMGVENKEAEIMMARVAVDRAMPEIRAENNEAESIMARVAVDRAMAEIRPENKEAEPMMARVAVDRAVPEIRAENNEAERIMARVAVDRAMPEVGAENQDTEPMVMRVAVDRITKPLQQEIESVLEQGYVYKSFCSEGRQTMQEVLEEMQQRTLCVQGGGEIPCHFSTLTTAIYHWSDLAECLEKYEAATTQRRDGRMDPLEPSERQLSAERRRVLRYPGVVAWFTAYKMELFYKHVLRYEDGQGVFEWGSGGIMHLHSINFGSCMPRVDPAAAGMQQPDVRTADVAARFAEMHEEYLTDWSLAKAEKWTFHEVDNSTARLARPGSPLHTDSESDGSEDLEATDIMQKCVLRPTPDTGLDVGASTDVFGQHAVADDVDFQRVFPTADSMAYVMSNGVRATSTLSDTQHDILRALNTNLADATWHPCRISIAAKALHDQQLSHGETCSSQVVSEIDRKVQYARSTRRHPFRVASSTH